MRIQKILVVKVKVADNAKPICDDTDFIGIAKMSVDIKLLDLVIGGSMGWHGTISSFVRIIVRIKMICFCICFKLFNNAIGKLGVILSHPGFNAGRIKNGHICFCRIKSLADWFGKINEVIKD